MNPLVCVATPGVQNWWPNKLSGATLDYTLVVTDNIDPDVDLIDNVLLSVAPSGSGEMQPSDLTVSEDSITVTMSGGQPTRVYTILAVVTMSDGRVFEYLVYQGVPALLPTDKPQISPDPSFGTPVEWTFESSLDLTDPRNSIYVAIMAGF